MVVCNVPFGMAISPAVRNTIVRKLECRAALGLIVIYIHKRRRVCLSVIPLFIGRTGCHGLGALHRASPAKLYRPHGLPWFGGAAPCIAYKAVWTRDQKLRGRWIAC